MNLRYGMGILASLMMLGCAGKQKPAPSLVSAPSTAAVKKEIERAEANVTKAIAHVEKLKDSLNKAKSHSERIDNKATVILENWWD
jgi:hypothetical protein